MIIVWYGTILRGGLIEQKTSNLENEEVEDLEVYKVQKVIFENAVNSECAWYLSEFVVLIKSKTVAKRSNLWINLP